MKMKTKQVHATVPEEIHRRLRIALAEDQQSFATWLHNRIVPYLLDKGKLQGKEGNELANLYINNGEVYEDEKPATLKLLRADFAKKEPKGKRGKGKGA
jgi:hypothetical protein